MFTIKNYTIVKDLEEAYKLNQTRNNVILGGLLWLKMSEKQINTAIDLKGLGLNNITEDEDYFTIGCMTTLREMETHESLNSYFNGIIRESVRHIVGVQFRNSATIGGSIFPLFGFSTILSALLVLDTEVELYKSGRMSLAEFVQKKNQPDNPFKNDILTKLHIKKDSRKTSYHSHRMSSTDFPVLVCAMSKYEGKWRLVLGARPQRAILVDGAETILSEKPTKKELETLFTYVRDNISFDTNFRGSEEYRGYLAEVFIRRAIKEINTSEKES